MNNLECPQCGECYHVLYTNGYCECGECFYYGSYNDFKSNDEGTYYTNNDPFDDGKMDL